MKEITVSTFCSEDEKGVAPRSLYEKYGFVPDALVTEMGYPNQKYVLHPEGAEKKDRQTAINRKDYFEDQSSRMGDGKPSVSR